MCSNALTTHVGNTRAGVRLLPRIHFILPLQLTLKSTCKNKNTIVLDGLCDPVTDISQSLF